MKIAAAYIRVSTDDQIELSPDSQLKQIRDYAKKNGYIVPPEYVFQDDGISGRTASKRPGFNRMIGIAKTKPKPFDAILLWKFSRFARNREDSIVYKSMLRKQCGISVISISENVGDDKMSVLMEAMIEAMDEYYSINLAEEVRRGMMEKISRGGLVSSAPLGYNVVNGELSVNESEAETVRYIYESYLSGKPMIAISRELNDRGVKTKTGKIFENRVIKYILKNPTYIGKHRWCPEGKKGSSTHYRSDAEVIIYDGKHKPIIDEKDYEAVQIKLMQNRRHTREIVKHENMLRGLVKCHTCGQTLTMSVQGGQKYMQCIGYTHGKCKVSHAVKYDYLCDILIKSLQDVDLIAISKNLLRPQPIRNKNDEINKLISREESKLMRCKEAYQNGIDTMEEYRDNKAKILEDIDKLKTQLVPDIKPNRNTAKNIKNRIQVDLPYLVSDSISPAEKNEILKKIIEKVVYDNTTKQIEVWFRG